MSTPFPKPALDPRLLLVSQIYVLYNNFNCNFHKHIEQHSDIYAKNERQNSQLFSLNI